MDKKISPGCKNEAGQCNDIVFSDFLIAARSGWWLIVGLILSAICLSLIYDSIRPPLYEARATIRVGWVPLGSNTLSIEPIKDLVAMTKDEHVLLPLFEELGFSDNDSRATQLRDGLFVKEKFPGSNLVEFKLLLESRDNSKVWLDKLISMKIAEHSKIIDGYVFNFGQLSDCMEGCDLTKKFVIGEINLDNLSRLELLRAYAERPWVERTIVSDSVKVSAAHVFPSLKFLIFSSVVGGVFLGVLIYFFVLNIRWFFQGRLVCIRCDK